MCGEHLAPFIKLIHFALRGNSQTSVTAVTERVADMGDTPVVDMVRRACTKVLFEPGDTRQQWKGEAAASFVS